jgi:hypothetical protein
MEAEFSLPCSQAATDVYPKQAESSFHTHIPRP